MPRFITFDAHGANELAVAGGKGASLAASIRELPVPPGVVATADAYREFVAPLQGRIRQIVAGGGVDKVADEIQGLVQGTDLPATWREELERALAAAGVVDLPVAVRSSGTLEDLPGAAFAGQHDTILGVRGSDAILNAVRTCYASLWNAHAMRYRERLGVDHLDAAMAVVVQLMVEVSSVEAAGVAFSVDPVRGSLDEVLINAAFGLGETVVGGEEPVDEFRTSRSGDPVAEEVADKPRALVSVPGGGAEHVVLPGDQRAMASLTPEQRAEVAALAVAAEQHHGFPQDIEWAYNGGQLFLLQSRPVTRVAARWTRDESAERFPTPVTPLTWDLVEAGFHASLNHSFALMGLPPFHDKWFAMKNSWIYGNQTAVDLYAGRMPTRMFASLEALEEAIPYIADNFRWVQELPARWMRDLDTYLLGIGALLAEDLEDKDLSELWDHVMRVSDLGMRYFLPNIAISLTQRTLYDALNHVLRLKLDADTAGQVFGTLIATDTKTAQVNDELWRLSRLVREDRELRADLDAHHGEAGVARLGEHPGFAREFDVFLERHGHRELDFDAYHPTWVETPHIVLDQVRMLAARDDAERAIDWKGKAAQTDAELAVIGGAPEKLRYLVREIIRLAREYTMLDDLEHYQTTRLTLPLRRALKRLGSRLVARGVLDAPMDVFFVPVEAMNAALASEDPSDADLAPLRQIAAAHKDSYERAIASTPAWVHGEADAEGGEDGGDSVAGTAGSPGSIEGEVYVVHGPAEFASFPEGAILVARTTNPAWTTLFYQASGVVTESGGALSHGAVTARELGLPAVMAIRDATTRFRSGQRVRVDGTAGSVTLL